MALGENIKKLRKEKKITQIEFAKIFKISNGAIAMWETDKRQPDHKTLLKIADFFGVTVDFLLGRDSQSTDQENEKIKAIGGYAVPDKYKIAVVGQVVAGKPIESPEYLEGYIYIDYKNPDEYFALRVSGDSMLGAGIVPNALLVVHKQNYAVNGDIIVASIDGESTVKRYKESNGAIILMPENTAYNPILVTEKNDFYIFGKVVEIRQKL